MPEPPPPATTKYSTVGVIETLKPEATVPKMGMAHSLSNKIKEA
jgi:hypothetical protein